MQNGHRKQHIQQTNDRMINAIKIIGKRQNNLKYINYFIILTSFPWTMENVLLRIMKILYLKTKYS